MSRLIPNELITWLNLDPKDRVVHNVRYSEPHFAVIYPMSSEHAERIFEGNNIFCKYKGERNVGIGSIGFQK
jgi:hypothetical protein